MLLKLSQWLLKLLDLNFWNSVDKTKAFSTSMLILTAPPPTFNRPTHIFKAPWTIFIVTSGTPFYRQQTKLREGNVFTGVCPFVKGVCSAQVRPGYLPLLLLISGGNECFYNEYEFRVCVRRPVQTCSLEDLPPSVLTSSSGHQNMYGYQAGSRYVGI